MKTQKIILISLLSFLVYPFAFSEDAGQNKNILILFSLVPSIPTYHVMTDGIRTSLTRVYGDDFNLHMEYLETERYPKGEYPKERFDPINEKYNDMGFGEGAIGGYVLSFKKIGMLLGESAVKILKGTDPNSIIINESDYYEYLFDWRELKRWGLVGSNLIPKGSTIRFEEVNFFQKYSFYIILAILFLVLQSLLIFNLVRLNRKQKLITRQLIDSENRFRALVREDRILRMGQLTASLSHELNQPLTAILSTAQAGLRFIESDKMDPAFMKEILENIVEDDKRAAAILSSIRSMLKLEKRDKEKINLNKLIEEIINIYQSEATEKQIKLNVKLADQPVYIQADRIQIQQVLLNFFTNAAQAIEMLNAIDKTIVISETADNDYVTVSVRDYGKGIEESLKDKIFKPFITSKKEGSGIGLAISRTIIHDHQGKIWVENMPDGGAQFSFSLKIIKND